MLNKIYLFCLIVIGIIPFSSEYSSFVSPEKLESKIPVLTTAKKHRNFSNDWTPKLETAFQQRAAFTIDYFANPKSYGNNYGENEKRSYPKAMFDFLAGNRKKAIAFLQEEDQQKESHQHTEGIDYYFCFTLKGQIRKYFLFGEYLDPTYKQRMYEGAKKWTKNDPLSVPHPLSGYGDGSGRGWSIQTRGLWVDGRNTDNLRAMRETSVYLMAQETGNEETRLLYKEKIRRYVWALYNIGMGEWDSTVYHGHTFAPYLNLYDFAQDQEVKQMAKAALDWMSAAAAIKYYRGGWAGPVKRDYGGDNLVFGSSAARTFWLYFGDNIQPNPKPEMDTLHLITSSYRPPAAIVALAKKQFSKPVEILATKPLYENWKPGNDQKPGYWETTFIGETYQMGSIAGTFADGDVAPFKLMTYNSKIGVDYFVANTGEGWVKQGKNKGDQIGQSQNLLIWLHSNLDSSPTGNKTNFLFQLPNTAKREIDQDIWFLKLEKTWLALFPINLSNYQIVTIPNQKRAERYQDQKTLKATINSGKYSGFALIIGEKSNYQSYKNFKRVIKQEFQLDLSNINQGKVALKKSEVNQLSLTFNQDNLLPFLTKKNAAHQWDNNLAIYNSLQEDKSPIYLGWKEGNLKIKVNDLNFDTNFNLSPSLSGIN